MGRAGRPGTPATVTALVLAGTALLAAAPFGQLSAQRAVAAPAFGAAAALAVVSQPGAERLPMVVGVAALGGAVTAAVARSWRDDADEALTVWMVAGSAVFVLAGVAAVLGVRPAVVWSVLLLLAMLSARFVPSLAVDVPDQVLLDSTAWRSPRGRPATPAGTPCADAGHREGVSGLVARGSRLVTAGAAAVAVVAVVAAPLLLATATLSLDRIGAWVQVFCAGGALLLLAARSYATARPRAAAGRRPGLLGEPDGGRPDAAGERDLALGGLGVVLAGAGCVAVAVATGRGWRSLWWSRRAEQAEGFSGAFALAAALVATGLFSASCGN